MTTVKEKVEEILAIIQEKFPDEKDLKQFPGISKSLIIDVLKQTLTVVGKLKEYDHHFETILLKRELSDCFAKIRGNLKKDFAHINAGAFNSVLKTIAYVKEQVSRTYFTVVNEPTVRTEEELLQMRQEYDLLITDISNLKKAGDDIKVLTQDIHRQSASITQEIESLKLTSTKTIENALADIEGLRANTVTGINNFYEQTQSVKDKADTLFAGMLEKEKGTSQYFKAVEDHALSIETKSTAVETVHKNVEQWNIDVTTAMTATQSLHKENEQLLKNSKEILVSAEEIRVKLSGKPDSKNIVSNGLIYETEILKKEMGDYLTSQKDKYLTQFVEIEGLLAGATSVGLAKAYQEQKESYRKPLFRWSVIFVVTLIVMTGFSGYVIYQQFSGAPIKTLDEALTSLFRYLPFYVPTIWLVAYASKQQSQARRLQQEYAFKETNAKSFQGHKEQIEKLIKENEADKQLLENLMAQMVVITGHNPSSTLDHHTHNDSPPLFKFVERIFPKRGKTEKAVNGDAN